MVLTVMAKFGSSTSAEKKAGAAMTFGQGWPSENISHSRNCRAERMYAAVLPLTSFSL